MKKDKMITYSSDPLRNFVLPILPEVEVHHNDSQERRHCDQEHVQAKISP